MQYISSSGEAKPTESMDKKYLVNALIKSVEARTMGGANASEQTINNVEALKAEIITRLGFDI